MLYTIDNLTSRLLVHGRHGVVQQLDCLVCDLSTDNLLDANWQVRLHPLRQQLVDTVSVVKHHARLHRLNIDVVRSQW